MKDALFNYLSQNVHKNRKWMTHLLEVKAKTTDFLFIQEPPHSFIKFIPSGLKPLGTPLHDTVHHPAWKTAHKGGNALICVNKQVLDAYAVFERETLDKNLIALAFEPLKGGRTIEVINVYNNPELDTLMRLLDHLE